MEEDPVFIGILMTSHYFDNPAYSGELTISDYYVVELMCIVDFLLTQLLTMWIFFQSPSRFEFLKNRYIISEKITGRTVKWDAENTVICREMKYFKKFLLKSK